MGDFRPRLFLSGPMRARADFNFESFFNAELDLVRLGYAVENPARNDNGSLEDHLVANVARLVRCDALVLLPGAEFSVGSKAERAIAEYLGMPILALEDLISGRIETVPLRERSEVEPSAHLIAKYDRLSEAEAGWPKNRFGELLRRMAGLHERKRTDYTGQSGDILHNYRMSAAMAGIPMHTGIFARLCEKVVRISSILQNGGAESDTSEKITDTCLDLSIIALLLLIALEEKSDGDR
jgi:hypothetical protein